MKVEVTMCHSHLLLMLMNPTAFSEAVVRYEATSPDMNGEGFNGYMEIKATFYVNSIQIFGKLFDDSRTYPSDKCDWYHAVRNAHLLNMDASK